jgi:hypothetical protein
VKLTSNLHLVPESRIVELYLHSPIRLHDMLLGYEQGQFCLSFKLVLMSAMRDVAEVRGMHGHEVLCVETAVRLIVFRT